MTKLNLVPGEEALTEARKSRKKAGMVRIVVQLTQAHYDELLEMASEESPIYPQSANQWLSNRIDAKFDSLMETEG